MTAMLSWADNVKSAPTITALSASSALPVQNLADRRVQKVWRSLLTSSWFGVDFGANVPISVLGLFGCTLLATDTVRHRLSTVSLGAGDVLDTGAVACNVQPRYFQHLTINSPALTARYWQCDIGAASRAALGYFDIGRAWAGDVWSPSINIDYGWAEYWQDDAGISKSQRSGAVFTSDGALYRRLTATFQWLNDTDKASAMELDAACGSRGQMLFIPDSAGSPNSQAILGRMAGSSGGANPTAAIVQGAPITQNTDAYPARYSKSYTIEQDL